MDEKIREWITQAEFDIETAEFMFQGERYFYAVFMCHLSLEKALKGIYCKKLQDVPPKVHNLVFLISNNRHQSTGGIWQIYRKTQRSKHCHTLS